MKDEGYKYLNISRHGLSAYMRYKQWWYFEGLDPSQKIYYIFLAMKAFPKNYISFKVIDYQNNKRWAEDYFTSFKASSGNKTEIFSKGNWGSLKFFGKAEDLWKIQVKTKQVEGNFVQKPLVPIHRNRLYTKKIEYFITQFINNEMSGTLTLNNSVKLDNKGYGYSEHNWGVQPGHSTTHWLHF